MKLTFFKFVTFFSQILLGCLFIITIVVVTLQIFFYTSVKNLYKDSLTRNLTDLNKSLELKFKGSFVQPTEELDKTIKEFGDEIGTRITLIDATGKVVADSKKDIEFVKNHYYREEIQEALTSDVGISTRFSDTVHENMHYVARAIYDRGELIGFIRLSLFTHQINDFLKRIEYSAYYILPSVFALAFLGFFFFAKNLSRPLILLKEAAEKVGKGDFSTKVLVEGGSEFSELADSFNEMTQRINNLFSQLLKDSEELNSIIFSVKEGIVVIEEKTNQIILANDKIKYLSKKYEKIKGRPYWEVIKNNDFRNYVDGIWQNKIGKNIEISIGKKHYFCSTSYLPLKKCLVAVFFDISEQKKLEKEKKIFIANVSHELRTPLTSIKGFVEALQQNVKSDTEKRHLKIIDRNAQRLILMVEDLLILSNLEKNNLHGEKIKDLDLEIISVKNFFENLKELFQKKAEKKGLVFEMVLHEEIEIEADTYMLEQVFINLIDNAIKYSENGYVRIEAKMNDGQLILAVQDSGIGIPKKYRDRIFQRFYVIDKSRSRELGGTGLGLSIVKHIVMLHGWKINLSSKSGEGTSFEVIIDDKK